MSRTWVGATMVAALALTACGHSTTGGPGTGPTTSPPSSTGSPSGTPTATMAATAFFVRSGTNNLYVEPETHQVPTSSAVARAAFTLLVGGTPTDPDLRTMAPAGTSVLGVSVHAPTMTVDLSGAVRSPGSGSAGEIAFAQQLAHTAAQFAGVTQVLLHVDGQPVTDLWGHVDWSKPIVADPLALSPVDITLPAYGATVGAGRLTVKGVATVFEGVVSLSLTDPSGRIVERATAQTCGGPCRGSWAHTFARPLTKGRWVVTAWEVDASGRHDEIQHATLPVTVT